ncbi:MAG TPA: sulfurtransferase TusA family protein [Methanomassiliicoccales archaeon]|nr:sulfurtransferase TusA family protein [Methanomassiliicoccales archaeon]
MSHNRAKPFKVAVMNKDESLDCKGLMCPMPIVRLAKKMKEMQVGKILELVVDDPGSKEDVPAWCSRTGNELVEMKQEGNVFYYYIKKKV